MRSIRDYINLVTETDLIAEKVTLPADPSQPVQTQTVNGVTMNAPANAVQTGSGGTLKTSDGRAVTSGTPAPDPNAAAAAKAKLTPSQLKWLGGADATDPYIMAKLPKPLPGEQVPGATPSGQAAQPAPSTNAPLAVPPGAEPDAAPQAAGTGLAEPTDADVAGGPSSVNAQGQNVTMPDGTNPETGEKTQTAAAPAGAPGAQDDVTGVDAAVAAQAAAPSGQAAQPANRDAMPFGKAFADAKAKGEKEFTWKGKKYAVQMAAPKKGQAAQPAKPGFTTGIAPKVSLPGASQSQNDALSMMAAGNMGAESVERSGNVLENNTTGYTELQRILSIVNHK